MVSTRTNAYYDMIKLLKKARNKKKWTQRDLAPLIGSSQPYISKYENREIRLDIVDYYRIAQVLEISDEEILKILHQYCK